MNYKSLRHIGGWIKEKTLPALIGGALCVGTGLVGLVSPSTASAGEWQRTRGMVTVNITDFVASEVNTAAWNARLDLGYRSEIGNNQSVSAELDWDYGKLRDEKANVSNFSPDNFDLDIKYFDKANEPSWFSQFSALSDHDFRPFITGFGGGYRLFVGPLAFDLGFQGTKDIMGGSNWETSYRADLAFRYDHPLEIAPGLIVGLDARSQRSLAESGNRQDIFEFTSNYKLSQVSSLVLRQRFENPFQKESSKRILELTLGYKL